MPTLSVFLDVPLAQKLEGSLLKTYKQDDCPKKIFLAYRETQRKRERQRHRQREKQAPCREPNVGLDPGSPASPTGLQAGLNRLGPKADFKPLSHPGIPMITLKELCLLIFCWQVGGVHTVGDNGAFQLGAQFLKIWRKDSRIVYIISSKKDGGQAKHGHPFPVIASPSASDPQTHSITCLPPFPLYQLKGGCVPTESHGLVFQDMGFTVCEYSLWDSKQLCMDPNVLLDVAEQAPHGCIFVIGNIGDCKLTQSQWARLIASMKSKQIFPFFDIPYQGLSTGNLEEDTGFLQYFVSQDFEFFCSQSLSKIFGIYDEGVGVLVVVALNNQLLLCVLSQLMNLTQALWLNPPTRGARIITSILCNPALQGEWKQSLKELVENIMLIKEKVKEKLRLLGTPGSWDHITDQNGPQSYLGLNSQKVEYLVKKKHIYIPKNGRINFTCINAWNIDYITQSINEAVLSPEGSE
ncbi:putative aspartate aminotransferase, cytoplasmic 2 isoform 2-T2 [Lycaon pictus]